MKIAITTLIALAVGAIGGALVVRQSLNAELEAAVEERASRRAENRKIESELDRIRQRLELSRYELEKMARERDALREELKALEKTQSAEEDIRLESLEALEAAALLEPEPVAASAGEQTVEDDAREGRRESGRPDSPWRDPEARREFMNRIRERSMGFLQERIDTTPDPVSQQRLASIGEYLDYMMDLGLQMREAETDEERAALRDTLDQVRGEFQGLVREQQDYMVRQLAEEYGITDAAKQDEFIASLGAMRQSPFFSSPMMQWGFGRAGRGRGNFGRPPAPEGGAQPQPAP